VAYRYQPLFSYAFKDALTPNSTGAEIAAFFDSIAASDDDFMLQTAQRSAGHMPNFQKGAPTHVAYKEVRYHHLPEIVLQRTSDVKFIFLIRDPRAVISSWIKAKREFRLDLGWDVHAEWRDAQSKNLDRPEEYYGFNKWKESASAFLDLAARYPNRVHLVRYSDLLAKPTKITRSLFSFCDLKFGEQSRDFVAGRLSGATDSDYSVFRAPRMVDDGWRHSLPVSIREAIENDLATSALSQFLKP
jgi:hypothetical protein